MERGVGRANMGWNGGAFIVLLSLGPLPSVVLILHSIVAA